MLNWVKCTKHRHNKVGCFFYFRFPFSFLSVDSGGREGREREKGPFSGLKLEGDRVVDKTRQGEKDQLSNSSS